LNLIKSGGGNGPYETRQPEMCTYFNGAKSHRNVVLKDEVHLLPFLRKRFFYLKKQKIKEAFV
jgi:hypothetical protein